MPTWLVILGGLLLLGFVVFAFRQGDKIKNKPEGVPPEHFGGSPPP